MKGGVERYESGLTAYVGYANRKVYMVGMCHYVYKTGLVYTSPRESGR